MTTVRRYAQSPAHEVSVGVLAFGSESAERSPLAFPVVRSDFFDHIISGGGGLDDVVDRVSTQHLAGGRTSSLNRMVAALGLNIHNQVTEKEFNCSFRCPPGSSALDYVALGWLYEETTLQPYNGNIRMANLPANIGPDPASLSREEVKLFERDTSTDFVTEWAPQSEALTLEAAQIKAFRFGRWRRRQTWKTDVNPTTTPTQSGVRDYDIGKTAEGILKRLRTDNSGPSFRQLLDSTFDKGLKEHFYHHERVFLTAAAIGFMMSGEEPRLEINLADVRASVERPQGLDTLRVDRRLTTDVSKQTQEVVEHSRRIMTEISKGKHLQEFMEEHNDIRTAMALGYLMGAGKVEIKPEQSNMMVKLK